MIDPKSIAFDIDGVIANTMQLFIEIARIEHGVDWVRYEDITSYSLEECLKLDPAIIKDVVKRLLEGNYQTPLYPIDGAAKALGCIGNRHPILMVTARPVMGPIDQWMKALLSPFGVTAEIILTGYFEAKTDVLLERKITHFVEDRLETCFLLDRAGIVPILFKQPWNRQSHPFTEVATWDELVKLIDCK
jgi:5'(3')-deoxyribonucleotidase